MKNVTDALNRFAESGYKHNDVRWRHFGTWQGKVYLLDLGDITKFGEAENPKEWVKNMMDLLRRKLEARSEATPTPRKRGRTSGTRGRGGERKRMRVS